LYWLAVGSAGSRPGGGGFRLLVAAFTFVWLAAAVYPLVARRMRIGPASPVLPVVGLGLAVFAAAGPWLLNDWIRGDFDRYAWVIHQGWPCSSMGGGPGMLWVFGTSWLAAFGALAYAASHGLTPLRLAAGLGVGAPLLGVTAATMFPEPAIFARVLGCS
jgi:hypothetical protein